MDSTLDSVDSAEHSILGIAGNMGFDEDERYRLGMAIREAMVNAVVHGNKYSTHKKVHLTVWQEAGGLKVIVADEGNGFEMARVPDPLEEENLLKESGRGILLMQAFVDELMVRRRSPAGTEVTLVKYLAPPGA
jgi:serine/threonine-protein kinase RsbW